MPLRTTNATKAAHMISIPMSTLPRTFRDAVSVTRALNIRYIWIDSLCIVQDDLEDWEQEAAKMASIYEGSFLTIAAADSANSNGGLFLDSIIPPSHFNFIPQLPNGASLNTQFTVSFRPLLRPRSNDDKLHLHNAPLYQRGWAFQELVLSPRSIHFREHQLYWKCHSSLRSEDGTLDEIEKKYGHSSFFTGSGGERIDFSDPVSSTDTWWRWVANYTTRSLTRSEDRVAAITGMIHYFQRVTGDTPILGLWERTFICDLYWSAIGKAENSQLTGPSWSWFSHPRQPICHRGNWFDRESDGLEPRLESFNVQWTGNPFTSKLVSSTLHISGVVRSFKVIESFRWQSGYFGAIYPGSLWEDSVSDHYGEVNCTLDDGSDIIEGLSITCLFLFYDTEHFETDFSQEAQRNEYFLIISPRRPSGLASSESIVISDSAEATIPAYQRLGVGYFEVELVHKYKWAKYSDEEYHNTSWPNPSLMFDGCEHVTIELV